VPDRLTGAAEIRQRSVTSAFGGWNRGDSRIENVPWRAEPYTLEDCGGGPKPKSSARHGKRLQLKTFSILGPIPFPCQCWWGALGRAFDSGLIS